MTINTPITRIDNQNKGVIPTATSRRKENKSHAEVPSFGAKSIILDDNGIIAKAIKWIGENCSSPENRLILGATALASQPFIDYNNKDVDEKTREISRSRTIAKIIAGTTTGFLVRKGCIKLIDFCTETDPNVIKKIKGSFKKKLATSLIPDNFSFADSISLKRNLRNHKNSLGTCLSLIVMLVTNFAIDVPLTKFLTNLFISKSDKNKNQESNKGGI